MIRVTVELVSASTGAVTTLAQMHVCNEGGTKALGDYGVYVQRGRSAPALADSWARRVFTRTGKFGNYPRERLHVWNLVLCALVAAGYKGMTSTVDADYLVCGTKVVPK